MQADFQRLEDTWAAAVTAGDAAAAAHLLADDFVLSSSGGVAPNVSRAEWLQTLPQIETASLVPTVEEVRVFADVAVVRARLEWQATLGTRDLSGTYAITDVFSRQGDAWKVSWRISLRLPASA